MRSTPPPPSPIPTGKGSRCAANQSFTEYLEKSLHLPELELPESSFHPTSRLQVLADIDYGFLRSRSPESVDRMVWSAKEFGLFRIMGCGIPSQELRALADETGKCGWRAGVEKAGRERLGKWVWSNGGTLEFSQGENVGDQTKLKRSSHEIMEDVGRRLDAIAKQVILVLQQRMSKEHERRIQCMESVISLYRYSNDKDGVAMENQRRSPWSTSNQMNDERDCRNTALLRFHIPLEHSQFYAQSQRGPLSFDTSPSALVVTIGKQLEEWSGGELSSISEEKMWRPKLDGGGATLCIEFSCLSSKLLDRNQSTYYNNNNNNKIISLSDQIVIALCLILLHKLLLYLVFP